MSKQPTPSWSLAGSAALALMLAAGLSACGGGSETTPQDSGREQTLSVSRPGELVTYVQGKLRSRQAQSAATGGLAFDAMPPTFAATAPNATVAAPERSGTTVQEQGVDEADLLLSDGNTMYTLQSPGGNSLRLQSYARAADGSLSAPRTLALSAPEAMDLQSNGMVLSDDGQTLAVIGQTWEALPGNGGCSGPSGAICAQLPYMQWLRSNVEVQRVDTNNPAAPAAGERISIEGHLVDSRRIGDALYVVTTHTPRLLAEELPAGTPAAEREAVIAAMIAADVLPTVRRNGGAAQPLLGETDCYVQAANASLAVEITAITVFDLKSATLAYTSRCFVGGAEAIYMSPEALYLATTRQWYLPMTAVRLIYPEEIKTDIHKFALAAGSVDYRGSGTVAGHLGWDTPKKSYRFSEHNGDLRVVTYSAPMGWATVQDATGVDPSPATLTVLRERASDQTLQPLATLPNGTRTAALGKPGEQVYAVRFAGDRAYVVTFRRTDPLYVLDLSDPADPKAVGELEVAGYSEQLYPLQGGLLLGVGRDATAAGVVTGLKVALFDVANPAQPGLIASVTLGAAGSTSALDYSSHGLNMLVKDGVARVALPVTLSQDAGTWTWQRGLQRFEVDTQARTLATLPILGASSMDGFYMDNAGERSLQIGDQVYYLSAGDLSVYPW